MTEFGVSRHTVRAAILQLVSEGFVERHRGRGSYVVSDYGQGRMAYPLRRGPDQRHVSEPSHPIIRSLGSDEQIPGSSERIQARTA